MLVFQDEVIGYVESVLRELDFSAEAFAADVVREVGPGGSYIGTDHTAQSFRRSLWFPKLLDRQFYDAWLSAGAQSAEDRCRARTEELLASHQPEPLPDDLAAALDEVVLAARTDLLP
jgi:trimethylamine--corrinoid protein Co-methyltransferase